MESAKEYLKRRGLKNPPIDSGISGGGSAPSIRPSDMMEEWSLLNGKFRDKVISIAQSRITELEAENKKLREALDYMIAEFDVFGKTAPQNKAMAAAKALSKPKEEQ